MDIKIEIPAEELARARRAIQDHNQDVEDGLHRLVVRTTYRVSANAKRNAPSKFGKLRQSITEKFSKLTGEVAVNVDYAGAVEFGSKPHIIRPKKKKALAFKPGGGFKFWDESGRVVVKWVKHPGTDPQPYLTPAVEQEAPNFTESIKKLIEDTTQ